MNPIFFDPQEYTLKSRREVNCENKGFLSRLKATAKAQSWRGYQREPDVESGTGAVLAQSSQKSNVPSGYVQLAHVYASDEPFMKYRRFGALHARVLLNRQEEIAAWEQELQGLFEDDGDPASLQKQYERPEPDSLSRHTLLKEIQEKLAEYNSMILRMESFQRVPRPSVPAIESVSVREWLEHGPSMRMDPSDNRNPLWGQYTREVKNLFEDPVNTGWLDGPLDQYWTDDPHQAFTTPRPGKGYDSTWMSKWISMRHKRASGGYQNGGNIFLWMSHITSAFAFLLILDQPDSNNGDNDSFRSSYSLSICTFGYWYLSMLGIVVPALLSKGYIYARKVFLGGILACAGGFYTLNILLDISTASALPALPLVFTIVLVLIRTM